VGLQNTSSQYATLQKTVNRVISFNIMKCVEKEWLLFSLDGYNFSPNRNPDMSG
jgi:hypothetical protein